MRRAVNPKTGERLYLDEASGQWKQFPDASYTPDTDTSRNRARGALKGGLLNFGDELTAGVAAIPAAIATGNSPADAYRDIRDAERQGYDEFRQQNPYTAGGMELGGGLLTGLGGGARLAASKLGQGIAAKTVAPRMAAASATGASSGAITGAGSAKEMSDIPGAMVVPAGIGAIAGPLAEGLATLGQVGSGAVRRALSPEEVAKRSVKKAYARGGQTPQQVIDATPEGSIPADVNQGALSELENIISQPGKTRSAAVTQLTERSKGQVDEIIGATGEGRAAAIFEEIAERGREEAGPLYRSAYNKPLNWTDRLGVLFEKPTIQKFWKSAKMKRSAQEIADAEGLPFNPKMFDEEPSVMGIDYLQRGLKREIAARLRNDPAGARPLIELNKQLSKEMEKASPDLAKARSVWAGGERYKELVEEGQKSFTGRRGEVLARIKQLNDIDKKAFTDGWIQRIDDTISAPNMTADQTRALKSRRFEDTAKALLGKKQAETLFDTIEQSAAKQHTFNKVRAQSVTAERMAAAANTGSADEAIGVGLDALTGNNMGVMGKVLRAASRKNPGNTEDMRDLMGKIMLEADPVKQQQIAQILMMPPKPITTTGAGLLAPAGLGIAGGILASPR